MTRLAQPLTMNDIASVVISELIRSTVVDEPVERGRSAGRRRSPSRIASAGLVRSAKCADDDARERVGRADREVDPARDEHERSGGGDDQRRRLLVEDVEQVGRVANDALVSDRTMKSTRNGNEDPDAAQRAQVVRLRQPRRVGSTSTLMRSSRRPRRPRTRRRGSRPRSSPSPRARRRAARGASPARDADRPRISSSSDEISDHAEAVVGELDEEVVDRALGADVDAARRLVRDQDARPAEERRARTAPSAGCRPESARTGAE